MKHLAYIILSILLLIASGHAQYDKQLQKIEDLVRKTQKEWKIPGVAISIVKDDEIIFAEGFGMRELGKPGKVDNQTLFAVASNSKAFTASLLALLADEGKLRFDDPVTRHMPNFKMYDPYVTREMQIRDLLIHHSGLPTFGGDHLWIGNDLSADEIIFRLRYFEPTKSFRTTYQYQNLMYLVAGEVYPAVTGESWSDGIKNRILKPLGMSATNTSVKDLADQSNVAAPHEEVNGRLTAIPYDNLDNVAPAAALNSNVSDMAQWMRVNLNSGAIDGKQLLSAEMVKSMQAIHIPLSVSQSNTELVGMRFRGYGLGWGVSDYKGYKRVGHGGGMSGMISLQTLIPEASLGIMVMTNIAPTSYTGMITNHILDIMLDKKPFDWNAHYLQRKQLGETRARMREKKRQEARQKNTTPSLPLSEYAGAYHDPLSGDATISLKDGQLRFHYNSRHKGTLEHWHHNTFRVHWENQIFDMADKTFLNFHLNQEGTVASLDVTFYDPIRFEKKR